MKGGVRSTVGLTVAVAVAASGAIACNKGSAGAQDSGSAATTSATSSATSDTVTATATARVPAAEGDHATSVAWSGTYKSVPHGFYLPTDAPNARDWKDLKFQGEDASAGLGEGALELTVDSAGRVAGSIEGPVGPATIAGSVDGPELTAKIARRDPTDRGLSGTMEGRVAGDKLEGTMHLSAAGANVIRSATFSLAKK